jgi:hypothetical protein
LVAQRSASDSLPHSSRAQRHVDVGYAQRS